jgi:hypothetical protein
MPPNLTRARRRRMQKLADRIDLIAREGVR